MSLDVGRGFLIADPLGGTQFTPGRYRYILDGFAPNPILSFQWGNSCSLEEGEFTIYEIDFAANGRVLSFSLDFESQCAKELEPVIGSIRYQY